MLLQALEPLHIAASIDTAARMQDHNAYLLYIGLYKCCRQESMFTYYSSGMCMSHFAAVAVS
jgi:hypothetical protein